MALDSMIIFDTVERHLNIALSEDEVDSINTVGDIADLACKHVNFSPTGKSKPEVMFDILKEYIPLEFGHPKDEFTLSTVLREFMPPKRAQMYWDKMASDFNIVLPALKSADVNLRVSADSLLTGDALTDNTIFDLICWILALNYEKLIIVNKLVSKTEVELIVVGIVHEVTGIGVEDIALEYDMLEDLGIK